MRERDARAAPLARGRPLEKGRAGVDAGRLDVGDVGRGRGPVEPGRLPRHPAPVARHLDDMEVEAVEAGQPALARDHPRQLADGQPVRDGHRVEADERLVARLHQRPLGAVADGVRPVEDDEREAGLGRRLHRVAHRRDVGVEPGADVLHVEHEHVEAAELGLRRLLGLTVEAVDRDVGLRPARDGGAGLGRPADAVLGAEQGAERHVRRRDGGGRSGGPAPPSAVPTRAVWLVTSPTERPSSAAKAVVDQPLGARRDRRVGGRGGADGGGLGHPAPAGGEGEERRAGRTAASGGAGRTQRAGDGRKIPRSRIPRPSFPRASPPQPRRVADRLGLAERPALSVNWAVRLSKRSASCVESVMRQSP